MACIEHWRFHIDTYGEGVAEKQCLDREEDGKVIMEAMNVVQEVYEFIYVGDNL